MIAAAVAGEARPRLLRPATDARGATRRGRTWLRTARPDDAGALEDLIGRHAAAARLLPRHADELAAHAARFVVAVGGQRIRGCAELAPLGPSLAEVRSFVVDHDERGRGTGRAMMHEVVRRGRHAGFTRLCAFSHAPGFFMHLGFSLVPHVWLPEKISLDCASCTAFRRCGQSPLLMPLTDRSANADRVGASTRHEDRG